MIQVHHDAQPRADSCGSHWQDTANLKLLVSRVVQGFQTDNRLTSQS